MNDDSIDLCKKHPLLSLDWKRVIWCSFGGLTIAIMSTLIEWRLFDSSTALQVGPYRDPINGWRWISSRGFGVEHLHVDTSADTETLGEISLRSLIGTKQYLADGPSMRLPSWTEAFKLSEQPHYRSAPIFHWQESVIGWPQMCVANSSWTMKARHIRDASNQDGDLVGSGIIAPQASGALLPRILWTGAMTNIVFYVTTLYVAVFLVVDCRSAYRRRHGQCIRCGYYLQGLSQSCYCPECGHHI
jgi:hypothetical protein